VPVFHFSIGVVNVNNGRAFDVGRVQPCIGLCLDNLPFAAFLLPDSELLSAGMGVEDPWQLRHAHHLCNESAPTSFQSFHGRLALGHLPVGVSALCRLIFERPLNQIVDDVAVKFF